MTVCKCYPYLSLLYPYLIHAISLIYFPAMSIHTVIQSVRLDMPIKTTQSSLGTNFSYFCLKTQVDLKILLSIDSWRTPSIKNVKIFTLAAHFDVLILYVSWLDAYRFITFCGPIRCENLNTWVMLLCKCFYWFFCLKCARNTCGMSTYFYVLSYGHIRTPSWCNKIRI